MISDDTARSAEVGRNTGAGFFSSDSEICKTVVLRGLAVMFAFRSLRSRSRLTSH